MKVTLTYDDPLVQGNCISKTWHFPDKNEKMLKDLMTKFNGEGLSILPIEVEAQYSDGSKENILVMVSSLCEKNNRIINKKVDSQPTKNIHIYSTGVIQNEKKSIKDKIKSWFRH